MRVLALILLCVSLLFEPTLAEAHEGHAEAPGETAAGGAGGEARAAPSPGVLAGEGTGTGDRVNLGGSLGLRRGLRLR